MSSCQSFSSFMFYNASFAGMCVWDGEKQLLLSLSTSSSSNTKYSYRFNTLRKCSKPSDERQRWIQSTLNDTLIARSVKLHNFPTQNSSLEDCEWNFVEHGTQKREEKQQENQWAVSKAGNKSPSFCFSTLNLQSNWRTINFHLDSISNYS